MLTFGTLELGSQPRIAAAIDDKVDAASARAAIESGVDLLELRVDQFSAQTPEHLAEVTSRFQGIPLLGTIRVAAEGGCWDRPESERLDLFRALIPLVDAVDIELASKDILPEVVATAHAQGKLVIGSYHNFERTPIPEKLAGIANDGKLLEVDIVKVAAYCHDLHDVQTLAQYTADHRSKHLITVGMGPHGKLTRIFFPAIGSLLTYTFLGNATAPGQLTCEATIQYFRDFYPGFGQSSEEEADRALETPAP